MVWKYMREHVLPCGDMIEDIHIAYGHAVHEWAIGHHHISIHIHVHAEAGKAEKAR